MQKNKKEFEKVRKDVRKLQEQKDRETLMSTGGFEIDDIETQKQDRKLL